MTENEHHITELAAALGGCGITVDQALEVLSVPPSAKELAWLLLALSPEEIKRVVESRGG